MKRNTDQPKQPEAAPVADPTAFPAFDPTSGKVEPQDDKHRRLRPDLDRVVTKVFALAEFDQEYDRLEQALRLGEKRVEPAHVLKALDEAESNLMAAARLYQNAKHERERWELENAAVFADMRNSATRSLQKEKADGERTKQITDADVLARIAEQFPDEWADQQLRRDRTERTVSLFSTLLEAWQSRCRTLQTIYGKAR